MNFNTILEELDKLYEEDEVAVEEEVGSEEASVEEVPAEEAPAEEPVEEEPKQLICECDKCGALVIKDEADIVIDEESDLVNVEDECQFCEEAKGFKIIGAVVPYEAAVVEPEVEEAAEEAEDDKDDEELEELLDFKVPINVQANGNNVSVGSASI